MSSVAVVIPGGMHHPSGHVAATHVGVGGVSPDPSSDLSSQLGEHLYWCWGRHPCVPHGFIGTEVNLDTIGMTILVLAIILALAAWVRRHLSVERPRGAQNVLEYVFDFVNGFVADNLGSERTRAIGPLAVALFLFILISNYLDLLPPWFKSPTSDLNTTAGLALMVFILVQVLGMRARGPGGYVKHFFQPFAALAPLEVIMELTKPVTLAFRLFGNIFAGEVLIIVFAFLLASFLPAEAFAHTFAVGLGLFVGAIQAFIFTVLTVAYIGIATSSEEAH
jgi:F-type H+-transporting ATPase subunit a